MICYKGMTFCDYYMCQKFDTCFRAFTPDVNKDAEMWWTKTGGMSGEAPISMFAEKPKCFE